MREAAPVPCSIAPSPTLDSYVRPMPRNAGSRYHNSTWALPVGGDKRVDSKILDSDCASTNVLSHFSGAGRTGASQRATALVSNALRAVEVVDHLVD